MKQHSRYQVARKVLIFWCLFIGIGAVLGATGMFVALDGSALGMQDLLPYFQVLPLADILYQNYLFPGIALLLINGIPNLVAAYLLWKQKKAGIILGGILGITLMLWICIQFVIFPMNFMSTIYFIFGLLQAITGYTTMIFYIQEHFAFNEADYQNIGTNQNTLVVYFSRMGFTRKVAYDFANHEGAMLYEIKAKELTEGTKGFWWCGRFGMHRWTMEIEKLEIDLTKYEHITICAPIWVFGLASPMLTFLDEARGKIKQVDYVLVHHMNSDFKNVADEMDQRLGLKRNQFISITCHSGRYKKQQVIK